MFARMLLMMLTMSLCAVLHAVTDTYAFKMTLRVPQVRNNSGSRGKRAYEVQRIRGTMTVEYSSTGQPTVSITALTNRSFSVAGRRVTYTADIWQSKWNLIGSNATGSFKKPSVNISFEAQPSYVSQYEPTDDNSLLLTISGRGSSQNRISGYAAGTLGCGCTDYGHISPTRVAGPCGPLPVVDDVAAVFGSWSAVRKARRN